jgi:hypothetical protein
MKTYEYEIRVAETEKDFREAADLVSEMYGTKGYKVDPENLYDNAENKITLISKFEDVTIGTISLIFDNGSKNLNVDQSYPERISELRNAGYKVCEITKFAVSDKIRSTKHLASLYSLLSLYAYINDSTHLLIEVNPRHENYYKKTLGFEKIDEYKICERVNAPGVLLLATMFYWHEQIRLNAGNRSKNRNIFNQFFTIEELCKIKQSILSGNKKLTVEEDNFSFQIINKYPYITCFMDIFCQQST